MERNGEKRTEVMSCGGSSSVGRLWGRSWCRGRESVSQCFLVERETQDAATLEVPKGWVLLDRKARAERSMTDAVEKGLCSIRFS